MQMVLFIHVITLCQQLLSGIAPKPDNNSTCSWFRRKLARGNHFLFPSLHTTSPPLLLFLLPLLPFLQILCPKMQNPSSFVNCRDFYRKRQSQLSLVIDQEVVSWPLNIPLVKYTQANVDTTTCQGQTAITQTAELPFRMTSEVLFINLSLSFKKRQQRILRNSPEIEKEIKVTEPHDLAIILTPWSQTATFRKMLLKGCFYKIFYFFNLIFIRY